LDHYGQRGDIGYEAIKLEDSSGKKTPRRVVFCGTPAKAEEGKEIFYMQE
jgi:hypothetical protein